MQKQSDIELGDLLIKNSEVTKSMLSNKISVFVSDRKAEVILGEQMYGDGNNVFASKAKKIQDYLLDRTPTALKGVCSQIINSNVKTDDLRNYFCEGSTFTSKTDETLPANVSSSEVTYQGVLDMLSKAKKEGRIQLGLSQIEGNIVTRTNGYEICGDYKTCLFGFAILDIPTQNFLKESDITLIECSRYVDLEESINNEDWVDGTKVYLDYMCVWND